MSKHVFHGTSKGKVVVSDAEAFKELWSPPGINEKLIVVLRRETCSWYFSFSIKYDVVML